jgi:hypothetical protein
MCLSTRGLERVPWQAHGLAEDLEYSWKVRIAGGRIAFDRDGVVYATMLARGGKALQDQRRRWEVGRRELRRQLFRPLLFSGHLGPMERIASLVALTMPTVASLSAAYLALSLIVALRFPIMRSSRGYGYLIAIGTCHAIATLALLVHSASPFLLSFLPWRFALSLFYFPYYICWKFAISLRPRPRGWVRTEREPLGPTREDAALAKVGKLPARASSMGEVLTRIASKALLWFAVVFAALARWEVAAWTPNARLLSDEAKPAPALPTEYRGPTVEEFIELLNGRGPEWASPPDVVE